MTVRDTNHQENIITSETSSARLGTFTSFVPSSFPLTVDDMVSPEAAQKNSDNVICRTSEAIGPSHVTIWLFLRDY